MADSEMVPGESVAYRVFARNRDTDSPPTVPVPIFWSGFVPSAELNVAA